MIPTYLPFDFKRLQFLVRLAMTINKSQGKSSWLKYDQETLVLCPKERQDRLLQLFYPMNSHSACMSNIEDCLDKKSLP